MANAWIIRPVVIFGAAALATLAGEPAYVANDYMGVVWTAAAAQMGGSGPFYHYLTVDLGSAVRIDTVMAFGLPSGLPADATMDIQAVTGLTGGQVWPGPVAPIYAGFEMLVNGDGIALLDLAASGAPVSRYWRVVFTSATRFDLRVRRLVLGTRLVLARNYVFGGAFGIRDFGKVDFSDRGVMLRRRGRKMRTVGISFENAFKDEVERAVAPLIERVGNTECVALVTDPAPDAMRQRRCYFGPLVGDLGTVQRTAVGWRVAVNLVSLV